VDFSLAPRLAGKSCTVFVVCWKKLRGCPPWNRLFSSEKAIAVQRGLQSITEPTRYEEGAIFSNLFLKAECSRNL
jgi:hypothetical protein